MSMAVSDRNVLSYDPFLGDFGDQGDRAFRNAMVIARRRHFCFECAGHIAPGERHRCLVMFWADNREVVTYRFCACCCRAMAFSPRDDGKAIQSRYELGEKRRKRRAA